MSAKRIVGAKNKIEAKRESEDQIMKAYRKTIREAVFFLVFVVAAGAVTDDFAPAPWRGLQGSMYMEWSYDSDAPANGMEGRFDGAELNSFVPHPDNEDPGDWQGQYVEWGYEHLGGVPICRTHSVIPTGAMRNVA